MMRNECESSPASPIGSALDDTTPVSVSVSPINNDVAALAPASKKDKHPPSDMELMRERFSKLLLGEDMSGGGKGVSSALALSNAITNLAASIFGEQRKLEPMSPERKARWIKEVGWLLSVTDYIVEFVASQQKSKDGTTMEIMVTQQRKDLLINIPALRKLDVMLLGILDNFVEDQEFKYVSKDADESEKGLQQNEKWWLPTVKVPPNGLSEDSRNFLQKQKEAVNQVLKASMAINAQILADMEIPDNYIESLPKNGRASLGESIYRSITVEFFDPLQFLLTMDLSSEHKVLDLKNRMEASIVIWKRKMHQKDGKSAWGSAISLEKRELFEERAETILLLLKQQFPGIPQSSLEISKIQYNKDVGLSILESYSRVLETLANTVMSRIQDVLYADSVAQDPSLSVVTCNSQVDSPTLSSNLPSPDDELEKSSSAAETPTSMTLFDFMGWNLEPPEADIKKNHSAGNPQSYVKDEEEKIMTKSANVNIKEFSYVDKIEMGGLRSPTARH
ncbi:rho guanine nucleotide exchange factor 8 [Phtheirospermum japonicum]|uniref:Rho guanine nucleotide exchange factor 8 n=1 Tax=Phtheirospermum japonicum TaxID=374723 RepID=A0A830CQR5_9LAMI|nr:rho guanine nucleotide exchange factor 8 [Phtheirospermum japonicum]